MRSPPSRKKTLIAAIKVAISVVIVALLVRQAQEGNQFDVIAESDKNWVFLIIALILCAAAHLISFVRWRMLVNALDIPFSTIDAVRIGLIGTAFGLVSLGVVGGDSLRVVFAARHAKKKITQVIASVFTDRAIGMLTMFSFAAVGYLLVNTDLAAEENPKKMKAIQYLFSTICVATLAGWAIVVAFLLSPKLLRSRLVERVRGLPTIGTVFQKLTDVVMLYHRRVPTLSFCVLLSVFVNLCFIGTIYLVALGLNVAHPPFDKHFMIAPISMCANAVPLPGGIGGMEPVLAFLYNAMSIVGGKPKHGIVVAFSFRFILLVIAGFGAVAWFINRKQIRTIVDQTDLAD